MFNVQTCRCFLLFPLFVYFFGAKPFHDFKTNKSSKNLIKFVFLVVAWNSEGLGMFIYYFL